MMRHPACDFAKHMMQVAFAGTGVLLSDGATNIMPVAPHTRRRTLTAEQQRENRAAVHRAWQLHARPHPPFARRRLLPGLGPAPGAAAGALRRLSTRSSSRASRAAERLRNFVDKAAQATLVGDVFDDAATGQGLLNYFLRALNCGAIEVPTSSGPA